MHRPSLFVSAVHTETVSFGAVTIPAAVSEVEQP